MDEVTITNILTAIIFTLSVIVVLAFGALFIWTIYDLIGYHIERMLKRKREEKNDEHESRG